MNRNVMIATVVVILIAVVGFLAYQNFNKPGTSGSAQSIDVTGQPLQGSKDAKVTVVAFEDFKCPVCKQYDTSVVPTIEQKYVQTGKIQYYFINFPFIGPDSTTAANAGECVAEQSPTAFYDYAHILYRAQKEETTEWATPAYLKELAQTLQGVDLTKFASCVDSNAHIDQVNADKALGNKAGVQGTPSVYVNGKLVDQSWIGDNLDKAISAALGNS